MRTSALIAIIVLLLLAQAAHGQAPQARHELSGGLDAPSVAPPATTILRLEASRLCPAQALIVGASQGTLSIEAPEGVTFSGPTRVEFPQQVCAQEPRIVVNLSLEVAIADVAPTGLRSIKVVLDVPAASPVETPARAEAAIGITVVRNGETAEAPGGSGAVKPAPLPAVVPVALLLAALATRARRSADP